ncbi:glutamine-binding periplasmic protein precursor [mine drainage metagenome]|jgi:polar amino acid transport system substrate-binding protein|uniref:Glutamine-binding periplasmic protein n=1 Tax=mine drainage metagenome TaxID=410659 RepID=A0A1J5Q3Y5_9ZZZZ
MQTPFRNSSLPRRLGAAAGLAALAAVVGAQAATIALPQKYVKQGHLVIASDATYAPMEFVAKDGKTIVGADVDIGDAIARQLGVKAEFVNASFDSLVPALQSGKYDMSMSAMTVTKKREEVVDFVSYLSAGTSFYVKTQGGPDIRSTADLCGRSVAVEKGTTQSDAASAQSTKCKAAGKPAVDVLVYPDQNGANLALASGRAQVGMADSPVAAWIVKQSGGEFKLTGQPYDTAPYGVAVPKNSGLAKPVQQALEKVIASGEYARILHKWGITQGAVSTPVINGATQ